MEDCEFSNSIQINKIIVTERNIGLFLQKCMNRVIDNFEGRKEARIRIMQLNSNTIRFKIPSYYFRKAPGWPNFKCSLKPYFKKLKKNKLTGIFYSSLISLGLLVFPIHINHSVFTQYVFLCEYYYYVFLFSLHIFLILINFSKSIKIYIE